MKTAPMMTARELDNEEADDGEAGITLNADGSTTVKLLEPFTHGEDELTAVTVRKPTARDMEATDSVQGEMKKANALLAHLTGLSLAAVRKMAVSDMVRAQKVVASYMGKSQ